MATYTADLVVVGDTEAAMACAISARRQGVPRVKLLIPFTRFRNFSVSGLGRADIGKSRCIGGLYQKFSRITGDMYGVTRSYPFSPGDINLLFWRWLGEWGVDVVLSQQVSSVAMTGTDITSITTVAGDVWIAPYYVDGTMMGDLMALVLPKVDITAVNASSAGWTVGTESAAAFSESLAGFGITNYTVSAVTLKTDGVTLRNGVTPAPAIATGAAYRGIAGPGVRTIVTDNDAEDFPFSRVTENMTYPYVKDDCVFDVSILDINGTFSPQGVTLGKYDLNSIIFTTNVTTQEPDHWDYPEASYAARAVMEERLCNRMRSRLYYTAVEPEFAGPYQTSQLRYGLPRSEYTATRRFTTDMPYWREGRRLLGEYVMTEMDLRVTDVMASRNIFKTDSVCLATYSMDLKPHAFFTVPGNTSLVKKEGDGGSLPNRQIAANGAQIPYRAMLPKAAQCTNMMVVYCTSCTHVAWGSMRIICTNFMMGEAAGVAIGMAYAASIKVHAVDTAVLRTNLLGYGCKLDPVVDDGTDPDEPENPDTGIEE